MSKTSDNLKRPVLRYHGGKYFLAKWIISHFGPHKVYCEWFGGAGTVLMNKKRSTHEVYNDKWDNVVNLFRVLRDPEQAVKLKQAVLLTPFSRTEYNSVREIDFSTITDPVELARLTVFLAYAGFGSASANPDYSTSFRGTSNRSGSGPAHDFHGWVNSVDGYCERLRGVCIENLDFEDLANRHNVIDALHYLDPPYVADTRNSGRCYAHEMTIEDHERMIKTAKSMVGQVIISGYENNLYNDLLPD